MTYGCADAVATTSGWHSAVCGAYEMRRGVHCAQFTLRQLANDNSLKVFMGVATPAFDAAAGHMAYDSAETWMLVAGPHSGGGRFCQGDYTHLTDWTGSPGELKAGDVVVRRIGTLEEPV